MKLRYIIIILCCLVTQVVLGQSTLQGKVVDSSSGQTIPGVVVYLPQLKLESTTDINGAYKINSVPNGTYIVQAEILGYTTIIKQITIKGDRTFNISMSYAASNEKEVVVTALGNITSTKRSPVPVTLVTHDALLQQASTNVVDGIATQPGVTAITTGPGVSKPEIRGLGFSRVLTLFDGVRQQDFQWGDEHGIQIDPYAVYEAEIIRGPASLQYGSDAVGGVVSFKSAPFPEEGTVRGSILSEYQTNNGLIGLSGDVAGRENGIVWDVRLSDGTSHCYQDPKDGYVWGTASTEYNGRLTVGIEKKWGYSRLTVSSLHRTIEIPDGNRDSATQQFVFDYPINGQTSPDKTNFLSYNPESVGYQQIQHDMLSWQNSVNVGKGRIIADVGYTLDHREEIDSGSVASLNMTMFDVPYSVKYQVQGDSSGLKFTAGANGTYESMSNAAEAPYPFTSVFLVPNYSFIDGGGYGILEKDFKNLTLSGGARYDVRYETGQSLYLLNAGTPSQAEVTAGTPDAYTNFNGFKSTFSGLSGCVGASYQLPANMYVKANFSKSYRAPAITEVGENGVHPGTNNYEVGDPTLKPETGYEADVTYGYNGHDVNFEVDGFYNNIADFIFANRIAGKNGGDSLTQGYPTFKFKANTAIIEGVEAFVNIHPTAARWFELDNGFTYIYSFLPNQTDSTQHVPFTPAPRLTSELKLMLPVGHRGILRGTYIKGGLQYDWAQNNIYSANFTELASQAYTLINAGIGTNFVNPKTLRTVCSFYISVTNLTNLAYADHTSRPQYFLAYNGAPQVVTSAGQGIYNMGRNIGFKLVIPIGGSTASVE